METEAGPRVIVLGRQAAEAFDLDGEPRGKANLATPAPEKVSLLSLGYQAFGDLSLPLALVTAPHQPPQALLVTPATDGQSGFAVVAVETEDSVGLVLCSGIAKAANSSDNAFFVYRATGTNAGSVLQASLRLADDSNTLALADDTGVDVGAASDGVSHSSVVACLPLEQGPDGQREFIFTDAAGKVAGTGWAYTLPAPARVILNHPGFDDSAIILDTAGALWSVGPNGRRRIVIEAGLSVQAPPTFDAVATLPVKTPGYAEGGLIVFSNESGKLTFVTLSALAAL